MEASIALNRFGLGARPGEKLSRPPKAWLLDQLQRYDAKSAEIAVLAPSTTIAAELADYYSELRMERRKADRPRNAAKPAGAMPPMAANPAGAKPPMADMAPVQKPGADIRRDGRRNGRDHYVAGVQARAMTAVQSQAPFAERLVHFWANHFAVSADKLTTVGLAGSLEFEAIRPHLLGNFRDMLLAVEHHPAMLLYLDQAQSVGPDSPAGRATAGRGRKLGLNENLAREILELHTLGVRTGYSQADVTEFARAMTGWTVTGLGRGPGAREARGQGQIGTFAFAPRLHEPGTRTILGKSWAQQGEAQAAAVLDMLATHPATARHIATKLARHFGGDDPPAPMVARIEKAFLASNGDLPSTYRALVESPEAWAPQPLKFKSPWEWSISAYRALGTRELQPQAVTGLMTQLGQPVWRPGSPAGWDDVAGSWAGPDAVMRRVEAAERMAARTRDLVDARARAAQLFPDALTPATAQAIARAESPGQGVALLLVAPEFMRR